MTLTPEQLKEIEERADECTLWSVPDIPRLVAEVRRLQSKLAVATEALKWYAHHEYEGEFNGHKIKFPIIGEEARTALAEINKGENE